MLKKTHNLKIQETVTRYPNARQGENASEGVRCKYVERVLAGVTTQMGILQQSLIE